MIRNISAVVIGLLAGMAVNLALFTLALQFWPMPEGVTFEDAEGFAAYIKSLPVIAMLVVMLAHLGQAFVGGWIAAIISRNSSLMVAMIVGTLSMMAGIYNMLVLPLPTWMWIEIPLYLVAAWAAAQLVLVRRALAVHQD